MNRPVAKYYLSINGGAELEVFPINSSDLSISISQDEKLMHNYSRQLNKSAIFDKSVYDLISAFSESDLGTIAIRLFTDNYLSDYTLVQFNRFNCEFDPDNAIVKIKGKQQSTINDIIENWDIDHNILNTLGVITGIYKKLSELEFYAKPAYDYESPDTFDGYGFLTSTLYHPSGYDLTYIFDREKSEITDGDSSWQKIGNFYYRSYTYKYPDLNSHFSIDSQPTGYEQVLSFQDVSGTIYAYVDTAYIAGQAYQKEYSNGRNLQTVIQYLLDQLGLGLSAKSTFLWNDDLENGDPYPTYNYVARDIFGDVTEAENRLNNLTLFQLSDIKRPDATEHANIARTSLKKIINDLSILFDDIRVFIDANGYFRIEHIQWFDLSNGIDYTTIFAKGNRSYVLNKNKFSYKDSEINRFIEYTQLYSLQYDAVGIPVELISYKDSGKLTRSLSALTTDFEGILEDPDAAPNDGLLLAELDGGNFIMSEANKLTTTLKANGHLLFPNLEYYYHRHNKPVSSIKINDNLYSSKSIKKLKQQEDLNVPLTADFDENKLVKSELGWGEIDGAELSLKTGFMTLKLLQE